MSGGGTYLEEMMRRTLESRTPLRIRLLDVSAEERQKLDEFIDAFREGTGHDNISLCKNLKRGVRTGLLEERDIERLSVWCHTNMGPRGISDRARILAHRLLGSVPSRLCEQGEKRCADYSASIEAIIAGL
jgi:hypothetical protein